MPSACRVDTRQSDRQRNRRRDGRFSLPSVSGALGKAFAECPIKYTRQRVLCRSIFCRVCFAECHTRQRLCRVQYSLCRVPQALGKEPESSSVWWKVTFLQAFLDAKSLRTVSKSIVSKTFLNVVYSQVIIQSFLWHSWPHPYRSIMCCNLQQVT